MPSAPFNVVTRKEASEYIEKKKLFPPRSMSGDPITATAWREAGKIPASGKKAKKASIKVRSGSQIIDIQLPVHECCLDLVRNYLAASHLWDFSLYARNDGFGILGPEVYSDFQFQRLLQDALKKNEVLLLDLEQKRQVVQKVQKKVRSNPYALVEPRKRLKTESLSKPEPKKRKKVKKVVPVVAAPVAAAAPVVKEKTFFPPEICLPEEEIRFPEVTVPELPVLTEPIVAEPKAVTVPELPVVAEPIVAEPKEAEPVVTAVATASQEEDESETCSICKQFWVEGRWHLQTDWLCCDACGNWFHVYCLGMTDAEFKRIDRENLKFQCTSCKD